MGLGRLCGWVRVGTKLATPPPTVDVAVLWWNGWCGHVHTILETVLQGGGPSWLDLCGAVSGQERTASCPQERVVWAGDPE